MAHDEDPGSADGANESARGPRLLDIEQRLARLELELAGLRRQIAAVPTPTAAVRVPPAAFPVSPLPTADAPAVPPPPPPPTLPQPPAGAPKGFVPGPTAWAVRSAPGPTSPSDKLRDSFENRLGSQIFNRIGIVLVLTGTAWFLKLAIDRQWIGPTGRVIAGLLAGAGLVLWSERFRQKGFAAFSYSLKALGSGVLYLSLWAAFQLYHLLPAPVALGLMVLVTAWNAWMAWAQKSELLAAYALAGGFATPMLLSTGGNHETFLFTYLLAIDLAVVVLVRLRGWPRLLWGAFPLTMAYFIGWYAEFYAASEMMLTSIFIVLFDNTFSSVPIGRGSHEAGPVAEAPQRTQLATRTEDILLPLANAAFLSLALHSVLQDSGHHALLPWLMILLAAVYLGFMRLPQSRIASAIHLSIAIVFLTIAIPLKASGHWITAGWLVEGLALLWVATRLEPDGAALSEDSYASNTLRWLAAAALLLGLCGIFVHEFDAYLMSMAPFFGANTATALLGVAVFAVAAWIARSRGSGERSGARSWTNAAAACFVAIDLVALLLAVRELLASGPPGLHPPFQTADFATALVGLAIFAGVVAVSLRVARERPDAPFWIRCSALSTIAFNLVAVLTGVREIDALWVPSPDPAFANVDAPLQQALAISGFLMLYGAALLAVGFWKRSAFLRWQALALLVFTILKAFLYDMRNLSQGYRVISFLALGALLMAISFAYQKDWLGLRETPPPDPFVDNSKAAR